MLNTCFPINYSLLYVIRYNQIPIYQGGGAWRCTRKEGAARGAFTAPALECQGSHTLSPSGVVGCGAARGAEWPGQTLMI